jgi:asparagine synthase (glutamine-hydrolysing)
LSRLVRRHGIKVVLTGEGADEMFGGYDLFREGKVRRFWAKQPDSTLRPRALELLYPYLARSPVAQHAFARQFFGQNLDRCRSPGFAHDTRWRTTAAIKRLFSGDLRNAIGEDDPINRLVTGLPAAFRTWSSLAQDQFIEIQTLLSGYLLSCQGDRVLMANSVEGRFPFLDRDVVALADSLPPKYKLHVLNEKYVLKRAAHGVLPEDIIARTKQPYRAPDALSFTGPDVPQYVEEMFSEASIRAAGVFDPRAVSRLWAKCRSRVDEGQYSNTDNMAIVGVLSTQLVHLQYIANRPVADRTLALRTDVDRVAALAHG